MEIRGSPLPPDEAPLVDDEAEAQIAAYAAQSHEFGLRMAAEADAAGWEDPLVLEWFPPSPPLVLPRRTGGGQGEDWGGLGGGGSGIGIPLGFPGLPQSSPVLPRGP